MHKEEHQGSINTNNKSKKLRIFTGISIITTVFIFFLAIYCYYYSESVVKFIAKSTIRYISGTGNIDYSKLNYGYDKNTKSLKIDVENLIFKDKDSVKFIIYNLKTHITFSDILLGFHTPRYTEINGGVLYLSSKQNNSSDFQFSSIKWVKNLLKTIPEKGKEVFAIKNLYIKSHNFHTVNIKNSTYKAYKHANNQIVLKGDMLSVYNNTEYHNNIEVNYLKKQYLRVNIDLPPLQASALYSLINQDLKNTIGEFNSDITLRPVFRINADHKGNIKEISAEIMGSKGIYDLPKFFSHKHDLNELSGLVRFFPSTKKIIVEKLLAKYTDLGSFTINATISQEFTTKDSLISLNLENLSLDKLPKFWPINAESYIRTNVLQTLPNGNITKAKALFKIRNIWFTDKPDKEDIKAEINVENATIKYHKDYEPLHNANFQVFFTGHGVNFNLTSAEVHKSKLSEAEVIIPFENNPVLSVKSNIAGPIEDGFRFIPKHDNQILRNLQNSTGNYSGTLNMSVPLASEQLQFKDLNFKLNLDINDYRTAQNVLKTKLNTVIEDGHLKLSISDNKLKTEGNIKVSGETVHIDFIRDLLSEKSNLTLSAKLADGFRNNLKRSGYDKIAKIAPVGSITAKFTANIEDKLLGNLELNCKDAEIDVPEIGFKKKPNESLFISTKVEFNDQNAEFTEGKYIYDDLNATFSANYDYKNAEFTHFNVPQLKSAQNDASINYYIDNKIKYLSIKASKINLRDYFENSKSHDKKDIINLEMNINLQNVIATNGKFLSKLNHVFSCRKSCSKIYADIRGEKGSSLYLNYNEGTPVINLTAENLGEILSAINNSQNLKKGRLFAQLTKNSKNIYEGTFNIKGLEFNENSILFTIMKLTSITGILDILSQKNIKFEEIKGEAEFDSGKNLLLLENIYANSSSISISSKGKYDIVSSEHDFQGVITPNLYGINNLIGKLPIIGGDKGFIGITYKVAGNSQKRNISVNPLSILTPGFLRNIIQW